MTILKQLTKLHGDSLFRNSFYLMLATAVMAGFGFFFWLINARLFSTANIGLATTLISVMNMVAILSLIGFNATFIRYLPTSEEPNDKLNTGMILVAITATVLSSGFIVFVKHISPSLTFIKDSYLLEIAFIFFCITTALGILNDSVFLAGRQAKYTLINNTIFSAIKMVLPFAFIGFGAIGIFTAAALGQTIGLVVSMWLLVTKFNYRPHLVIKLNVLKKVWRFSAGNYASGVLNLLPMTVLPILITNKLGPETSAYFYIVMMIGTLLYVIPRSATNSFFAESSNDEAAIGLNIRKSVKIIATLLTPAILVLLLGGGYILKIFGKNYASGGTEFLVLVSLSSVALSLYAISMALFQVKKDLHSIIIVNVVYCATIIALSYAFLPWGLTGIGFAWLLGNTAAGLTGLFLNRSPKRILANLPFILFDLEMVLVAKIDYLKAWARNGYKSKTVLFYPNRPHVYHLLYNIVHRLGYKITTDPNVKADLVIAFSDVTFRKDNEIMQTLRKTYTKIINFDCSDISKEKVERIFLETFGYGMEVDPRTHNGLCVRKSNDNAKHDGQVIKCPTEADAGYIYQKVLNNIEGDNVTDIRIPVFKNSVPFILRRYRSASDRFDHTKKIIMYKTSDDLTEEEVKLVVSFCEKFGAEYCELDAIRDKDDKKLYIVDVNNTPGNPLARKQLSQREFFSMLQKLTDAFSEKFLKEV